MCAWNMLQHGFRIFNFFLSQIYRQRSGNEVLSIYELYTGCIWADVMRIFLFFRIITFLINDAKLKSISNVTAEKRTIQNFHFSLLLLIIINFVFYALCVENSSPFNCRCVPFLQRAFNSVLSLFCGSSSMRSCKCN